MGRSKKQTVGYKYSLGMHQILTHGPADKLLRYTVDERIAWQGESAGGSVFVNAPSLFGGEGREGGISGVFDVEMGGPDQGPNAYLASKLGGVVPSFRGVVGIVQRQMYLGNNPYLKKNAWRLQRIHLRQDGIEQWFDELAGVGAYGENVFSFPESFSNGLSDYTTVEGSSSAFSVSGSVLNQHGPGPGNHKIERQLPFPSGSRFSKLQFRLRVNNLGGGNTGIVQVYDEDDVYIHGFNAGWPGNGLRPLVGFNSNEGPTASIGSGPLTPGRWYLYTASYDPVAAALTCTIVDTTTGVVWGSVSVSGPFLPVAKLRFWTTGSSGDVDIEQIVLEYATGSGQDMNPAHIIRECLTDPIWGMGYSDEDIDDDSFMMAAGQLYGEGMGMSILWDRQMPIEQFVQEVIKHINAALYVARYGPNAGKFVLRLIRGDYELEDLPVYDEGVIEKFENYKRVEVGELVNSVTVNYWDRATGKTASTTAQDPALVQQQGAVINTAMQYPGFTNDSIAGRVALRDLQSLSTPLASGVLYLRPKSEPGDPGPDPNLLNIGDVIAVNWDDYGLTLLPMRVTALTLGDGKSHKVKATVTQDVFRMPQYGVVTPPDVGWEDPSQEPEPIIRQYAEELPYYELVQQFSQSVVDTQIATMPDMGMVGVAASRPQSGAINARIETDSGAGYEDVGVMDFSPSAILVSPLLRDTDEFEISGIVDTASIELGSYAKVGSEYMSVVARAGTLLSVKRGVLDTVPSVHPAGELVFFSDPFVQVDPTEYVASDEVGVRLLTVAGKGILDPALAVEMAVTLDGRAARPYPPANVKLNGAFWPMTVDLTGGEPEVSFNTRNRLLQTGGELIGWFDSGDVTIEPGATIRIRTYDDTTGDLLYENADITSPFILPGLAIAPSTRMELDSVADGRGSWQPVVVQFFTDEPIQMQNGVGYIELEDGSYLYTEN